MLRGAATRPSRWRSPRTRWSCTAPTRSTSRSRVFTNLTQDHLDFHPDMEAYFQAKRRLFAVRRAACGSSTPTTSTARGWPPSSTARDLRDRRGGGLPRTDVRFDFTGSSFRPSRPTGAVELRDADARALQRPQRAGRVRRGARARRRPARTPRAALARAGRVPGRFEAGRRGAGRSPCWSTTRTRRTRSRTCCTRRASWPAGRVICVFGAGGDRDRAQAAADGGDRRAAGRRGDRDLRQPALGGPGGDRRRGRGGRGAPVRARGRPARGDRPARSSWPARATSWSSPARATSRARSSRTAARSPSTTCTVAREALRAMRPG